MMRRTICRVCSVASSSGGVVGTDVDGGRRGVAREPLSISVGDIVKGFKLIEKREFSDVRLVGYEFEHVKTNAKLVHFDTDDTNNAFCIGFRTPAYNDKGTTHVLEHTVLCGSKRYPVRDPFFLMLRRSLSNFMNAMTGADYTLYPFATTNKQDFNNLLGVYMDAVLHPLLRFDDFKQEGNRVEVVTEEQAEATTGEEASTAASTVTKETKEKNPALQYNGVVFNEMRGVVSEPTSHYYRELCRNVLVGTHYEKVSGGYPTDVLELTHEELVEYHQRHYHPSNAVVMNYGDLPPFSTMEKLDEEFSAYEPMKEPVHVSQLEDANRFKAPKVAHEKGPVDVMGDVNTQKRVSLNFAIPSELESFEGMVNLYVVDQLLSSGPSSPLYKSLIDTQIGSRFSPMTGYMSHFSTGVMSYGVQGVPESTDDTIVEDAVLKTLKESCESGFDQRRVDSVVFQEELSKKHRSADYGVGITTSLAAWLLTKPKTKPLDCINWVPQLKKVAENPKEVLTPILEQATLKNNHRVRLSVSPEPKFLDGLQAGIDSKNKKVNELFQGAAKTEFCKQHEEWLARMRTPTDATILPTLQVRDIPQKGFEEPLPRLVLGGRSSTVHHIPHATNGLVYLHGVMPLSPRERHIAKQLLSNSELNEDDKEFMKYIPLMHSMLGKTGAGNLDFQEFSIATELCCGGISFALHMGALTAEKEKFRFGTTFGLYTTKEKLPEAVNLLTSVITQPICSEDPSIASRILSLAKGKCSQRIQSLQRSGNSFAALHATSKLHSSPASRIGELWRGIDQVNFSTVLLKDLQSPETSDATVNMLMKKYNEYCTSIREERASGAHMWFTAEDEPSSTTSVLSTMRDMRSAWSCHDGGVSSQREQHDWSCFDIGMNIRPSLKKNNTGVAKKKNGHDEGTTVEASGSEELAITRVKLPIDTSFAASAIPTGLGFTDPAQQHVRVACQLAQNEFLHKKVREEGGAYGSSAAPSLQGYPGGITMTSYRDPTPDKSIAAFSEVQGWLDKECKKTVEVKAGIDQAKLRLFSGIDSPYAADQFGTSFFLQMKMYKPTNKNGWRMKLMIPFFSFTTSNRVVTFYPSDVNFNGYSLKREFVV